MNKETFDRKLDEEIRVNDKRRSSQPGYLERVGEELKVEQHPTELPLAANIDNCFLEPSPGRVIVLPDGFKYKGRMIIPDNAKRSGTAGTILKVGQGCCMEFYHEDKLWRPLAAGDRVVYGTWTGTALTFEGRPSYRILHENEVLAILVGNQETKLLDVEA